ncbi:MAG: ABC transporter permease subunit [Clostridia bacterium]|nr:ABC transporter permease subunit [Clostridia bacterium]
MLSMCMPGLIFFILFSYLPMFGIIIAFKQYRYDMGIWLSPWNGFTNFKFMFSSPDAWVITRNTIAYNLIFIVGGLLCNVGLAIGLSELRNKMFSKVSQTILLMPHFLSYVIVSFLVLAFLHVENGIINRSILPALGVNPISWYQTPKAWPWILVIVNFWKTTGYGSVVYLAGIAGIDTSLYEAARVDGATRWQQIRYVTIPALVPLMVVLTILNVGKIFNSDFGLFYQVPLNSGALYPTTNVISTYVYNMLMTAGTGSVGMASAAALYQSVVGFILVMTTNLIVRKVSPDNALF